MLTRFFCPAAAALALILSPSPSSAERATVAAATNFLATLEALQPVYEGVTGHELVFAAGSTGSLYARIANGAPYDLFLAADEATPERAIAAGFAVPGTRFVYAVGALVLFSNEPGQAIGPESLHGDFHHLAIASPRTAPYGAAAREVMQALGVWDELEGRIAEAQSVGGAYSAVVSGAAELGFVPHSLILADKRARPGSYWTVPQALYRPLRQSAVLLRRGAENAAAREFLDFLRSPAAREIIARHGYGLE